MTFCAECGAKNKDDSMHCQKCGAKIKKLGKEHKEEQGKTKFVKADAALLNRDQYLFKRKFFSFFRYQILDPNTNEVLFLARWRWRGFLICDKNKNPVLELKTRTKLGMLEYDILEGKQRLATIKYRFKWFGFEFDIMEGDKIIADVVLEEFYSRFWKMFAPFSTIHYFFRWEQQNVIGNMNRISWSFMPRYNLDLRDDPGRKLNRKIALAAAVIIANRMYQRTHGNY